MGQNGSEQQRPEEGDNAPIDSPDTIYLDDLLLSRRHILKYPDTILALETQRVLVDSFSCLPSATIPRGSLY